ncbi:E3 SUMO-protein ligase ZBED1-like [Prorops nasuta]|uniref:E3 SUMO-protein ligase ZBED1-like n=1 Tax=Prorops nasuta TaxID=863751 RepID=UPI0034CD2047
MIQYASLKTSERKFKVYYQINDENPLIINDIDFFSYVKLKNNPKYATEYILKLFDDGKIAHSNKTVELIYFSTDGVDFKSIYDNKYETDAPEDTEVIEEDILLAKDLNSNKDELSFNKTISPTPSINYIIYKKTISHVWKYLKIIDCNNARCQMCSKILKSGGNTTNLSQHLRRIHPIQYKGEKENEQEYAVIYDSNNKKSTKKLKISNKGNNNVHDPKKVSDLSKNSKSCHLISDMRFKEPELITSAFHRIDSFAKGSSTAEKITNNILYMILADYCPLRIVEKKGFQTLIKSIAPLYKIPSRKSITNLLDFKYGHMKEKFIFNISKIDHFTVTCDIWSDITNKSYLSATIHYLYAENKMKNGTLCVYPLEESHTSEYLARTIKIALELFKINQEKISAITTDSGANIKKVAIQLFEVSYLQNIINKVKTIVVLTKRSTSVSDELKRLQIRDGKTEGTSLKFIQDVPTRWNCTFYMLERFMVLKDYVYPISLKCSNVPQMLNREELQVLEDAIQILRLMENAIQEYHENNLILAISSILDPQLKKLHFKHSSTAAVAMNKIDNILKSDHSLENNKRSDMNTNVLKSVNTNNLWQFHDELVTKEIPLEGECNGINLELGQYMQQKSDYFPKPEPSKMKIETD